MLFVGGILSVLNILNTFQDETLRPFAELGMYALVLVGVVLLFAFWLRMRKRTDEGTATGFDVWLVVRGYALGSLAVGVATTALGVLAFVVFSALGGSVFPNWQYLTTVLVIFGTAYTMFLLVIGILAERKAISSALDEVAT